MLKVLITTHPVLSLIRREKNRKLFRLHEIDNSGRLAVNLPTVSLVSKSRKFNQDLTKSDAIEINFFNFQFNLIVKDKEKQFYDET